MNALATIDAALPVGQTGDLALCRSALYSALSLGFRSPAQETVARLAAPEGALALSDAAAVIDAGEGTDLAGCVRNLAALEKPSDLDALTTSFRWLFGHTSRGPVSPYETDYGGDALFQQPQEMGDLAGFLRAFGLTLNAAERERIDHVSCECEFLAFLTIKEAYALAWHEAPTAEETRRAARLFLRDHLGRFGPAFARKLTREDRGGFYGALGELCLAFLAAECARLRVPPGSEFLQLRAVDLDDAPMACGTGSELLNIEPIDDDTE